MAREVFGLPDVGEGLTEAEILSWRVAVGDVVAVNQILVEIETAKAAVELPSPYAGAVAELLVTEGQTVPVGAPIIAITTAAAEPPGPPPSPGPPAAEQAAAEQAAAEQPGAKIGETTADGRIATLVGYVSAPGAGTRRPRRPAPPVPAVPASAGVSGTVSRGFADTETPTHQTGNPGAPVNGRPAGNVPLAKPPVRKLARELGVDLRGLAGSGPNGAITQDDVRATADGTTAAGTHASGTPGPAAEDRREPVRGVRRATAAAMVSSAFTAPHVTEFLTVDVTPMIELRDRLRATPAYREVKLSPLTFAAKAVCLAARRTPACNARWDEAAGEIVYFGRVQLGIAAATPRGLIVPVIRDADGLSLPGLAQALGALTATARAGTTPPADLLGGTLTITNVGVFGVDTGTPILNPGQSAILALGAVKQAPWVVGGELAVRTVCQLALSFDHRVVDGEQGSRFLADVGALLADPGLAMTY